MADVLAGGNEDWQRDWKHQTEYMFDVFSHAWRVAILPFREDLIAVYEAPIDQIVGSGNDAGFFRNFANSRVTKWFFALLAARNRLPETGIRSPLEQQHFKGRRMYKYQDGNRLLHVSACKLAMSAELVSTKIQKGTFSFRQASAASAKTCSALAKSSA